MLPEELQDRLKAGAAVRIGNKYYCPLHCDVHRGYDPTQMGITRAQYNHYVKTGQIKHDDFPLNDDGSCNQCDYYAGQVELDRREAEFGRAIEEYYEEDNDEAREETTRNLWGAYNKLVGHQSPEQKRRLR